MGTYIGIDPGLDGAICFIEDEDDVLFVDTPTVNLKEKGTKRAYDVLRIVNELTCCGQKTFATIERQQSMPEQGVASTFQTGFGFGMWIGVLTSLRIPYEIVAPVSWKKELMRDMPKGKGASIIKAKQLFPQAAAQLNLKKHHNRADALLIAEYGRRRRGAAV